MDFGEVSVWLAGVETVLPMFVMRLSHSGRAVHVCFAGEGQEAFLEGHTVALDRLGGVPRRIRYDNLSSAVTRVLRGRARVESDRFVALRSHYGFDSFFCEPGSAGAHEKGGVEGEVGRFRRRHLVPVPRVESLAELNALLEAADRSDDARHIAGRLATVGAGGGGRACDRCGPFPPSPSRPRSRCARRPTARRASRCAARATRCPRPTRAARWRCASAAGPSPPSPRAGWSPAMSAARTGGPRSSCSTISSRCCRASPARCPARSRSSRRAPRGASPPRTNASGSAPAAGSATARGRGR